MKDLKNTFLFLLKLKKYYNKLKRGKFQQFAGNEIGIMMYDPVDGGKDGWTYMGKRKNIYEIMIR